MGRLPGTGMSAEHCKKIGILGGRPKKYTQEVIEDMADKFMQWLKTTSSPWFEGFAIQNEIPSDRLAKLAKENEKFAEVYDYAKSWQKQRLIEGGLLNKYSPTITKLLLGSQYGIREQQELHHQGAAPVQIVHYGKEEPRVWESNSQ